MMNKGFSHYCVTCGGTTDHHVQWRKASKLLPTIALMLSFLSIGLFIGEFPGWAWLSLMSSVMCLYRAGLDSSGYQLECKTCGEKFQTAILFGK